MSARRAGGPDSPRCFSAARWAGAVYEGVAADLIDGVRAQLARVSVMPAARDVAVPWPGAIVVAAGLVVGVVAWLGGRAMLGIGVAPAIAGVVAIAAGVLVGAAVVERGLASAFDRWIGGRWTPIATGGGLLLRVVALWSTAPAWWLAALVVPAGMGRLAAIGLQRIGDVRAATAERTLVVGRVGSAELAAAVVAMAVIAGVAAGTLGLVTLGVGVVVAIGLGLALQVGEGELASDSLAVVAAAVELVGAVGMAAIAPASQSPFIGADG